MINRKQDRNGLLTAGNVILSSLAFAWLSGYYAANIMTLGALIVFSLLFTRTHASINARVRKAASILSFCLSVIYVAYQYRVISQLIQERILKYVSNVSMLLIPIIIICIIGLYCLMNRIMNLLFDWLISTKPNTGLLHQRSKISDFWKYCALFVICRIPYYLSYFPGVLSQDSITQVYEMSGLVPLSNLSPAAHTLLIKLIYDIGMFVFGSPQMAIALWTFVQLLIMSAMCAFAVVFLDKLRVARAFRLICILFYAFMPFNSFYSITLWKDIIFAAFILLFTVNLWTFSKKINSGEPVTLKQLAVFSFVSFGICTMKSNGYYAFLLCIPFIVIAFRKHWLKFLIASLCPFMIAFLINETMYGSIGVVNSDTVEKLSIPIQQVARVIVDGRVLEEDEKALLSEVVDTREIIAEYKPTISDPIKALIRHSGNMGKLTSEGSKYTKLYLDLGLKYPVSYIKAWIDQTRGYLEPNTYWVVAIFGSGNTIIDNDAGIKMTPLLGKGFNSFLTYLSFAYEAIPVYNLLWTVGLYMLLMLFAFALSWIRKIPCVCFVPHIILLVGMLLLSPVYSEFRYGYQTVISVPLLLGIGIYSMKKPDGIL